MAGTVREEPITAVKNTNCKALVQITATLPSAAHQNLVFRHIQGPYLLISGMKRVSKCTQQSILE